VTYRVHKLAPGSYDIILNGVIVASLARTEAGERTTWSAELLVDLPASERPAPFVELAHEFSSYEAACAWLGTAH
jgi:hypothetical protein